MPVALALILAGVTAQPFAFKGSFFEGCTCAKACAFELTGTLPGCDGAGFYKFTEGKYGRQSISNTRIAFVAGSKGWLRLYVDGPTPARRAAAKRFIMAALKDWGKPEAVEYRTITVSRKGNRFTGSIDGGKIMTLNIDAVAKPGGDFTVHKNIFNKLLHPDIMQGKNAGCTFRAGKRTLDFKDSNGFFHPSLKVSGKV